MWQWHRVSWQVHLYCINQTVEIQTGLYELCLMAASLKSIARSPEEGIEIYPENINSPTLFPHNWVCISTKWYYTQLKVSSRRSFSYLEDMLSLPFLGVPWSPFDVGQSQGSWDVLQSSTLCPVSVVKIYNHRPGDNLASGLLGASTYLKNSKFKIQFLLCLLHICIYW